MKRFLGLLLVALSIGSLGSLLGPLFASAASPYDNAYTQSDDIWIYRQGVSGKQDCHPRNIKGEWLSISDNTGITDSFNDSRDNGIQAMYNMVISHASRGWVDSYAQIIWKQSPGVSLNWSTDSVIINGSPDGDWGYAGIGYDDLCNVVIQSGAFDNNDVEGSTLSNSLGNSLDNVETIPIDGQMRVRNIFISGDWDHPDNNLNIPQDYEGSPINTDMPVGNGSTSSWTPDIKLLQGTDWLVELSDYNFFTFDKVAFTCGEHELAPVINWEVWDITDTENRQLIDTLVFGAPALVKYQAPKVNEDKRYEIVAYYSDCEGYNFTEASTKQFTVKKDGTLNPPDYMVVCIREDFPYINVQDCWAEVNDFLTILTFRTPAVDDVGGGVFTNIVDGCRELQVIDTWIFAPNQQICPQIPSNIRSIVTPFITFALGLMAASFIAHSKSVRSLN